MKIRSLLLISLAVVMGLVLAGCGTNSAVYTADHGRSFVYIFDNNSVNLGAVPGHHKHMTGAQLKATRASRVHKHATKATGTGSGVDIASGSMDLYLYDMTTNKSTKLNGAYGSLAFETVQVADYGTKLLFSADDSNGYVQIYLADAKLLTITQLTSGSSDHYDAQISSDGTLVTYDDDDGGLYYVSATGGKPTQITLSTVKIDLLYAWAPSFTPDNKSIVFVGDPDTEYYEENIYIARIDGTDVNQLTNPYDYTGQFDYYPVVSSDGSTVAFERDIDDYEYIYTVPITGENDTISAIQLTNDGTAWYPVYFGNKLLYLDWNPNIGGSYNDNIFSMDTDGSNIQQLTSTPYENTFNDLYYYD